MGGSRSQAARAARRTSSTVGREGLPAWGEPYWFAQLRSLLRKSQVRYDRGMSETLEERVRTVIDGSGMAQAEFADAIGMDSTKLSKSLSGRRRFSSLELARVADVGRMSVDWLITGSAPFRPVFARRARAADIGDEAGASVVERLVMAVRGLAELDRPLALPELPQLAQRSSWYLVEAAQLAARYVDALDALSLGSPCRSWWRRSSANSA